jgi:hypothetical protein
MSYVNRISLYEVIGNFVGNTGINNVNDMIDDLARWSAEAEAKIGSKHSFEKHECEIEVKNFKACLPKNFQYLVALNVKGEILDVTNKEFTMFDKAGGGQLKEERETRNLNSNQLVLTSPGVAQVMAVKLCGTFNVDDIINITITSNNCGKLVTQTFSYTVLVGDTVADIAIALSELINANNLPYTSVPTDGTLQISANDPEISLIIKTYTSSVTGSLEVSTVTQRVAPTKKNAGMDALPNNEPATVSENLASREAAELNTGLTATSRGGQFFGGYHGFTYPYGANSSKFSIENGYIYFTQVENGKVGIAYMGVMIDEQGWPMVAEDHAYAISNYLTYMYLWKRAIMGKVNAGIVDRAEQKWLWSCGEARGDDELPNQAELRYLANQWMQLVPLPNKSFF